MLVVLSSTARTRDILYMLRALAESSLGNCLFDFGLRDMGWLTGVKEYTSLGSLSLILIFSILSIVNLFTGSN